MNRTRVCYFNCYHFHLNLSPYDLLYWFSIIGFYFYFLFDIKYYIAQYIIDKSTHLTPEEKKSTKMPIVTSDKKKPIF